MKRKKSSGAEICSKNILAKHKMKTTIISSIAAIVFLASVETMAQKT
jgi:hypothetical protein